MAIAAAELPSAPPWRADVVAEEPGLYETIGLARPQESALHRAWRDRRLGRGPFPADDGQSYAIVFPGWPNAGPGPDFRGAVIENGKGWALRGDIELHVDEADWYAHGHHRDPAYRGVVLHVSWRHAVPRRPVRTAAGSRVPSVILGVDTASPDETSDPRPCTAVKATRGAEQTRGLLVEEGERRFEEKVRLLAADISADGSGQTLYRALLGGLGYSGNVAPFRELAGRLPLGELQAVLRGKPRSLRRPLAEALLFGFARLLPSQRGMDGDRSAHVGGLEYLWAYLGHGARPGEPLSWGMRQTRPGNAPARRIAAAAELAARFHETGVVEGLRRAATGPSGIRSLHQALAVRDAGYWAGHWDFGKAASLSPSLVGGGRAGDLTVNVVLPFFAAFGQCRGDSALAEASAALYREHPPLAENAITRTMRRLLFADGADGRASTAREQQGMLGLYKRRCEQLLCDGCRLGAG